MKKELFALALLALVSSASHGQVGAKKNHDVRVEKSLDLAGLTYEIDSDGDFKTLSQVDDDRTHLAWINSNTEKYQNLEIREVWAVGYVSEDEFPSDLAKVLMRKNHTYKIGAWKIVEMRDQEVAVFYVQIDANADHKSLTAALRSVISSADEVEQELTSKDDL